MKIDFGNRKRSTGKWVVPFVIFSIFVFTGVAVWLQYVKGMELSSTLITCFYGFCAGELWCLASIKKAKVFNNYKSEEGNQSVDDE